MKIKIPAVMIAALLLTQAFTLNIAPAEVNDPRIPLITPTPVGTQTTPITVDNGGGGGKIIVEGYFYFIQNENPWTPQPIRGAEVEVYDDDGILGRQKMGSGITDDTGHFRITGLQNPIDITEWTRPDIYVEVHASNWVTEVHDNPDWWGGGVYRFRTHVSNDVWDGDLVNFGQCTCPTGQNRVWDIFQTMQAGYWFMVQQTGKTPPKIRSFYNDILQGDTAFYQGVGMGDQHGILARVPDFIMDFYSIEVLYFSASGIHFKTGSDSHRTVLHEYGHYVMDLYMDISPPDSESPHWYEHNYSDQHGLVEGWAHFFSAVVRWWWGAPISEYRDDNPIETNYQGSGCEGSIAGILWDIFDSPAIDGGVDDDGLTMSFQTIWNVMTGYDPDPNNQWPLGKDHPWTIGDFWDGFKLQNPGDPVAQAVAILGNHGIVFPDTEPPVNPTLTESNIPVDVLSYANHITATFEGAYDMYEGQQVNVKEYVLSCNISPRDVTFYPEARDRYWGLGVFPDVGGGFTWTSVDGLHAGEYWLNVRALDSANNWATGTYHIGPFMIGEFGPATTVEFSNTGFISLASLLNQDTSVTLVANTDFATTHYEITSSDGSVTTGVQSYSNPFTLANFHLADGQYTLFCHSVAGGEEGTVTIIPITIDSTSPTTTLEITEPKTVVYTKAGRITHVSSSNVITLVPDDGSGSGVDRTIYRINNAGYDLGWQTYSVPFQLKELSDGSYWIEYYSTDKAGNSESPRTENIVLDNSGPSIRMLLGDETTIENRVTVTSSAFDLGSGIDSVTYTISHLSRAGPTPVNGFIDLPTTKLPNNLFSLEVDLSTLPNGEYLITAEGVDVLGNTAQDICQFARATNESEFKVNDLIAFTSERDGNREIYTMQDNGTLQTCLTKNIHNDEYPSWSPDGTSIAFSSDRDGNYEIYVMKADGSGQTRLTNNKVDDLYPCWSPDGAKIAFNSNRDGNQEIYVMNVDGSGQTRLTNNKAWDSGPKWSPDGAKIAFFSDRDGASEIYVMNFDGSEQIRLTNNKYMDSECFWSPDGRIAFVSDRDGYYKNYIMDVDGSWQTKIVDNNAVEGGDGAWSPDGTKIVFNTDRDGNWEIYSSNVDGSGLRRLTNNDADDYWPAWQSRATFVVEPKANGKIAFQSDRDGSYEIYSMDPDGSQQTRLTNNNYKEEHPTWSPDGLKIAFSSGRGRNWDIYVMNADGSGETRLTYDGAEARPSWSPDGTKIAFESRRDGDPEIFVMNADGSEQTKLTNNHNYDSRPIWSLDGTKIIFYSDRDGNYEIYVMNTDGSGQTRLSNNNDKDEYPSWSPDGAKILFVSNRDGNAEIYTMNADGSGQTRLTNNIYNEGPPSWSPDGAKIAFTSIRDGKWNIYIMNVDGSEETKLTNNVVGPEGDWWPVWQSLSKQTALLTLHSSTSDPVVDEDFSLNATLSTSISGTVTLIWSIDDSGFIYKHNETMTEGRFNRVFAASDPGNWSFKVFWAGDDEYNSVESNIVSVKVKPLPTIVTTVTANPTTVYSGGSSKLVVSLTGEGSGVKGATINLVASGGGVFSSITDLGNGTYVATYTVPDFSAQTVCTITASAQVSGYQTGSGQTQVTVKPLIISIYVKAGDSAPVADVVFTSISQPSGQSVLSGASDGDGLVGFNNVLKGDYSFRATKSGYDDKVWTLTVQQGQAYSETITLVKQSGGVPGYPASSVVLALLAVVMIFSLGRRWGV